MSSINSCIFTGRLTRDAELTYTKSGAACCKFALAVDSYRKDKDDYVSFFDFEMWGPRAEKLNQYLLKGGALTVNAEASQDRWEQDGNKRAKIKFKVNDIVFGARKGEGGSGGGNAGEFDEEEIPF